MKEVQTSTKAADNLDCQNLTDIQGSTTNNEKSEPEGVSRVGNNLGYLCRANFIVGCCKTYAFMASCSCMFKAAAACLVLQQALQHQLMQYAALLGDRRPPPIANYKVNSGASAGI